LIAFAQCWWHSRYGVCLQYFSGIHHSSFVDTSTLVCYGLMSFITYQPSTRLAVKSSAGKEGRQPTAFQEPKVVGRISQAKCSGPLL
jgi:hypothetical protein